MDSQSATRKKVLIVGASGAIGEAVAHQAVDRGYHVIGTSRQRAALPTCDTLILDVRSEPSVRRAYELLPTLDLIVFAQGYDPSTSLRESSPQHISNMLETHVSGIILCLKHFQTKLAQDACIVLLSSVAARKGSYDPAYAAAKGAIQSLTRSLAVELRATARVIGIAPGLVEDSPVHRSMTSEHAARHANRMFGGRLIQASEVAHLILHVFENVGINSAVIPIDGGFVN